MNYTKEINEQLPDDELSDDSPEIEKYLKIFSDLKKSYNENKIYQVKINKRYGNKEIEKAEKALKKAGKNLEKASKQSEKAGKNLEKASKHKEEKELAYQQILTTNNTENDDDDIELKKKIFQLIKKQDELGQKLNEKLGTIKKNFKKAKNWFDSVVISNLSGGANEGMELDDIPRVVNFANLRSLQEVEVVEGVEGIAGNPVLKIEGGDNLNEETNFNEFLKEEEEKEEGKRKEFRERSNVLEETYECNYQNYFTNNQNNPSFKKNFISLKEIFEKNKFSESITKKNLKDIHGFENCVPKMRNCNFYNAGLTDLEKIILKIGGTPTSTADPNDPYIKKDLFNYKKYLATDAKSADQLEALTNYILEKKTIFEGKKQYDYTLKKLEWFKHFIDNVDNIYNVITLYENEKNMLDTKFKAAVKRFDAVFNKGSSSGTEKNEAKIRYKNELLGFNNDFLRIYMGDSKLLSFIDTRNNNFVVNFLKAHMYQDKDKKKDAILDNIKNYYDESDERFENKPEGREAGGGGDVGEGGGGGGGGDVGGDVGEGGKKKRSELFWEEIKKPDSNKVKKADNDQLKLWLNKDMIQYVTQLILEKNDIMKFIKKDKGTYINMYNTFKKGFNETDLNLPDTDKLKKAVYEFFVNQENHKQDPADFDDKIIGKLNATDIDEKKIKLVNNFLKKYEIKNEEGNPLEFKHIKEAAEAEAGAGAEAGAEPGAEARNPEMKTILAEKVTNYFYSIKGLITGKINSILESFETEKLKKKDLLNHINPKYAYIERQYGGLVFFQTIHKKENSVTNFEDLITKLENNALSSEIDDYIKNSYFFVFEENGQDFRFAENENYLMDPNLDYTKLQDIINNYISKIPVKIQKIKEALTKYSNRVRELMKELSKGETISLLSDTKYCQTVSRKEETDEEFKENLENILKKVDTEQVPIIPPRRRIGVPGERDVVVDGVAIENAGMHEGPLFDGIVDEYVKYELPVGRGENFLYGEFADQAGHVDPYDNPVGEYDMANQNFLGERDRLIQPQALERNARLELLAKLRKPAAGIARKRREAGIYNGGLDLNGTMSL